MKGKFITFEGPDGSGKTTIATSIVKELENQGFSCIHTREPGGIEIAEKIRNIILDPNNTTMDSRTEALLYAASRRQHLVEKVFPALKEGKIVICERFLDSSLAYQGYGRELGFDNILKINEFAIENCYPDLTIYLDIKEEEGLKRIADRSFKDRLDLESLEFHKRVNKGYLEVLKHFKNRIKIVDASKTIDEVIKECLMIILKKIND